MHDIHPGGSVAAAPAREDHGFKRVLGRLDAIALGFGAMKEFVST